MFCVWKVGNISGGNIWIVYEVNFKFKALTKLYVKLLSIRQVNILLKFIIFSYDKVDGFQL